MKNKGPEREDLKEKQKNDAIWFLCLCGEKDREFLRIPDRERKTDDYVRLMCISLIFGFHYPAMRLLRESEDQKRVKAVLARLSEVEGDYGLLASWMDSFISEIQIPGLRRLAAECWNETKKAAEPENFHISQLLKVSDES